MGLWIGLDFARDLDLKIGRHKVTVFEGSDTIRVIDQGGTKK